MDTQIIESNVPVIVSMLMLMLMYNKIILTFLCSLQELIATLKDSKGAEKVVEWHEKLEQIRLSELKTKRQMSRLRQQITFLEGVIKKHEQEVLGMEEEKIKLTKVCYDTIFVLI